MSARRGDRSGILAPKANDTALTIVTSRETLPNSYAILTLLHGFRFQCACLMSAHEPSYNLLENAMDRGDIKKRVVKVVSQVLGVEPEIVTLESHFALDLGAESTQWVELMVAFEHEFRVEMDEDAAFELQTVAAVVNFFDRQLS